MPAVGDQQLKPRPRQWVIEADDTGELDENEIALALAEAALIVRRVGGVVMVQSLRRQLDPELYGDNFYVTGALAVRWESYSPAVEKHQEAAEPTPAG